MDDDETHLTPTEARQATPDRSSFRVLVFALIALAIAAVALYGYFYSADLPNVR